MKYMPAVNVKTMNRLAGGPFGDKHTTVLYDRIESTGMVQYEFLLVVFDNEKGEPVYFVASERNAMWLPEGDGSHFLGVFTDAGHANLGSSNDWGDQRKFFPKAISLAAEHFGVSLEDK